MIKYIKNINLTKNTLIFIAGALFILLFLKQCDRIDNLKDKVKQVENISNRNYNNLLAAHDSIETYIYKNKQLVSQIRSFEFDINSVELKNKDLLNKYSAVLNKNKDLRGVTSLISTELTIKDSIINSQSNINRDSTGITINFNEDKKWDKYNWRTFNGQLRLIKSDSIYSILTSRFDFNQGISLTTSIINDNGKNVLRITTPYSGVVFTDIENINLVNDKLNQSHIKKGGWSVGLGVNYGINLNNNQIISTGPSIGVGVFYSPKWLRF